MKASIKISIDIGGQTVELTEDQARALYADLHRMFGPQEVFRSSWTHPDYRWNTIWCQIPAAT